jgi:collagen type III alpha
VAWFKNSDAREGDGLIVTELWGQRGAGHFDIVGESQYGAAIRALLPKSLKGDGAEVHVPVSLVHDPNNRHDSNAIEVRASSGVIGFLSRENAARYAPVLASLQRNGRIATTQARIWGRVGSSDYGGRSEDFFGSVRLDLAEPHMLVPANLPPLQTHVVLPAGSAMQVTGEEKFMNAIAPFLNSHRECWVHATAHAITEQAAKTPKTVVEIRIDDEPVGRLTPKMSSELLPVIEYLAQRGRLTCVRGVVKGNELKADVVLHTKRAGELDSAWLATACGGTASAHGVATSATEVTAGVSAQLTTEAAGTKPAQTAVAQPVPAPAPLPPAGWYPNQHGPERLRYWDGQNWTEHVSA